MPLRENIFQDNRGEKTYFMTGLGTIINTVAIIVGGIFGHFTGRLFKQEQQAGFDVVLFANTGHVETVVLLTRQNT